METLSPHIKEEENEDLPKLESKLSHEESVQTAKEFHLTKKFVPTRSHPSAPDQPVSITLLRGARGGGQRDARVEKIGR